MYPTCCPVKLCLAVFFYKYDQNYPFIFLFAWNKAPEQPGPASRTLTSCSLLSFPLYPPSTTHSLLPTLSLSLGNKSFTTSACERVMHGELQRVSRASSTIPSCRQQEWCWKNWCCHALLGLTGLSTPPISGFLVWCPEQPLQGRGDAWPSTN